MLSKPFYRRMIRRSHLLVRSVDTLTVVTVARGWWALAAASPNGQKEEEERGGG